MKFPKQQVLVFFFLFLSFFLVLPQTFAAFSDGYVRNEVACTSPFSFRYYGLVQGDPGNGIGPVSETEWNEYFNTNSQFTTTCLPGGIEIRGDADEDDNGGILFGGFLYVVEDQNQNILTHRVQGPYRNAGLFSDVSYLLLAHNNENFQPLLSTYSAGNFRNIMNEFVFGQSLYTTNDNLRSTRGNTQTEEISIPRTIPVGLYFIQGGLDMRTGRGSATRDGFAELSPVRFGTQTTADTDANLNNIAQGYAITNRPLTVQELNTNFGDRVEEFAFLCNLAGGEHKINDSNVGVCCGNTPDDEGIEHRINNVEDRCVRQNDGQFTWQVDQLVCEAAGGDFNIGAQITYQANDGSDGCCGDDPNDAGYVSPDGRYFCNQDRSPLGNILSDTDQDTSSFFWDVSSEYQVHEVEGTDFISNGNEWYMCQPQNTDRNDSLLGTSEFMAQPFSDDYSFSTCLDGMNFLLENDRFDTVPFADGSPRNFYQNPNPSTRFITGDSASDQADWSCSPEANNNMDGFFDVQNTLSCVSSCFTTSGATVASLFPNETNHVDHFCIEGFNIPGCPDVVVDQNPAEEEPTSVPGEFDNDFFEDGTPCRQIINDEGSSGYLCTAPDTYCKTRMFYSTQDTNLAEGQSCCKAPTGSNQSDVCIDPESDEAQQGQLEEQSDNPSERFLCHQWNTQERIIECCPGGIIEDGSCYAVDDSQLALPLYYQVDDETNGIFVTAGGSNYVVEDFNYYETNSNGKQLINGFLTQLNMGVNQNRIQLNFEGDFIGMRSTADWSGFTELHFDVRYTADLTRDPFELVLVYDTASQENNEARFTLRNYLVTGTSSNKFQHGIIPLPQDLTLAKSLRIETINTVPGIDLDLDHLYLSEHVNNYPEFFCSGDIGQWVENLDGPSDDGFANGTASSLKDEYQLACNGIPSFGWTGHRCCGDDTTLTSGENYTDTFASCFNGNVINNNQMVSVGTQNEDHDSLLLSEGVFYFCDAGIIENPYQNLENTHGSNQGQDISQTSKVGDLVGGHACSDTGTWINIGDVSRTKELASYMYSIISVEDVYGLHCDAIDQISTSRNNSLFSYFSETNVHAFCAAQIEEGNGPENRTLLGFSVQDSQENFLNALGQYLVVVGFLNQSDVEAFVTSCDQVDFSDQEEFYACESVGSQNVRMLIHQDKPIYLLTFLENRFTDAARDFQGIFSSNSLSDFISNALYFFNNLFTDLFVEDDTEELDTRLPSVLASSAFDLDSVVIQAHRLDEDTYKQIVGFVELPQGQVVVEYDHFYSSVLPLAQQYYTTDLNYQKGENRQLIQFTLEDAEAQRNSFEPEVDWRRITSALRINNSNNGSFVTGMYDDGILDIGEACDNAENGTVLLKNRDGSTCEDYAPNLYGGNTAQVLCSQGVIDLSLCNYCGDFITDSGEECDDGNNLPGDGCSASCTIEFCGDGIRNNGELCDAGPGAIGEYQAIACAQATNCNAQCSGFGGCIGDSICQAEELAACTLNPLANADCGFCDVDEDGYPANNDCDDTDPGVYFDCRDDDIGSGDTGGTSCSGAGQFESISDCQADAFSRGLCPICSQIGNCYEYVDIGVSC